MKKPEAYTLSIGVLAVADTWLTGTLLPVPVWVTFIAWASFFVLGGGRAGFVKRCRSTGSQSVACPCASTSQSSLSMPRETPVNKSAVSASPALLAVSMAVRVVAPKVASALDKAAMWDFPEEASSG